MARSLREIRLRAWARLDVGRLFARLLCAVFAALGALPLAGSFVVRTEMVRLWAASETARVLHELLGVEARYSVEMRLLPLEVALRDVVVPATDGGTPALQARRIAITPRIPSLLAGRLDVGDIEIEEPRARIVLRDGDVRNVAYRLPAARPSGRSVTRAPFASIAVTDARVVADLGDTTIDTGPTDVDVFAETGPAFEIAVRSGETSIRRDREDPRTHAPAVDDDVVCQLDLRVRAEPGGVLVRRLSLFGGADADPAPGTRPKCRASEDESDPDRVLLRLSQVRLVLEDGKPSLADGHVTARAPASIAGRFGRAGPFKGWVGLTGDAHYDRQRTLPDFRGKVRGGGIELGPYQLADSLETDVDLSSEVIHVLHVEARYGHGTLVGSDLTIAPLEPKLPFSAKKTRITGLRFPDLMERVDVTKNTIVQWFLDKTLVDDFKGTLDPLHLEGDLYAETSNFEVFDRAYHDPARHHMIGVKASTVRGRFGVKQDSIEFLNTRAEFAGSAIDASVSVGFHNDIWLSIGEGSKIDLAAVSPLVDVPMAGVSSVHANMAGKANSAVLKGEIAVQGFEMGGFSLGDIESSKVRFVPLVVDLTDVRGKKGKSKFVVPSARLDFNGPAALTADALVKSEALDVRDFFSMWHFDKDPRFDAIFGSGPVDAQVRYDLGGPGDPCKGGALRVNGKLGLTTLDLFDEHYDSADARFDFRWKDIDASYLGIELDAPSVTLKKGGGTLLASVSLRDGGVVRAHAAGTDVPLSKVQAFGTVAPALDGRVSGVAEVSGTLDELSAQAHVRVSPTRIGRSTLAGSEIAVTLEPAKRPFRAIGKTGCGRPIPAPYEKADWDADASLGTFHTTGQLFGGQIAFDDLEITRQRRKNAKGNIDLSHLDLGALAELSPAVALAEPRVEGRLSARLHIEQLPLDAASRAAATATVTELWGRRGAFRVEAANVRPFSVASGRFEIPGLELTATAPGGQQAVFDVRGIVDRLSAAPTLDVDLSLRPAELSAFATLLPRVERAEGQIRGNIHLGGPLSGIRHTGRFELADGEIAVRGLPAPLTKVGAVVTLGTDEIAAKASAIAGGGSLKLEGTAPLRDSRLGDLRGVLTARGVTLPIARGVRLTMDANLQTTWSADAAASADPKAALPHVTGDLTLLSFEYTRPVTMTADIATLARRGKRTKFESYDPENDFVDFDITVRSSQPLKLNNNLIDAKLSMGQEGLVLNGTNQLFGLRGQLRVVEGGRIRLRRNDFDIRQGVVEFDDLNRIAPRVDVTAVTEYRRYNTTQTAAPAPGAPAAGAGSASSTSATGGHWLITMRAHGDMENLRVDLTSDPALSQDDIFLLLTLGLTRAELDQSQSASLGGSVALEALGRLTGAEDTVTQAIPVIDDFHLGSAYSSRTGQTEPTVTIGKRLSQRIRAYVTSGVSESREVRSNVEWKLSPRVGIEGSYDNVNDISSSTLGNLGADVRWRLEFE